jgi:hypothetical protein
MTWKLALAAGVWAAALWTTGCATMTRPLGPGPRDLSVSSEPEGATVSLDGVPVGETPSVISVPQSSSGLLVFSLEGYKPQQVQLDKNYHWAASLNGWPVLGYVPLAVHLHDREREDDASWRDDLLQSAGIVLGATLAGFAIDEATGCNRVFSRNLPAVRVTLSRREP